MLSPTSLAGLGITPADWFRPVREVSPAQGPASGNARPTGPIAPVPLTLPGGDQSDGTPPSRSLPRGSLLDLSV
jgi:hypothetical protein